MLGMSLLSFLVLTLIGAVAFAYDNVIRYCQRRPRSQAEA